MKGWEKEPKRTILLRKCETFKPSANILTEIDDKITRTTDNV